MRESLLHRMRRRMARQFRRLRRLLGGRPAAPGASELRTIIDQIPAMVAFSFIMNRTNRMVSELDQCTLETLDIIRQRAYGVETKRVA